MQPNEIISAITERVKDAANVRIVFGEVIESGEVSLIPVASIKVSGGGGMGKPKRTGAQGESAQEVTGLGMGIGVTARPIGYIEVHGDSAQFIPITDNTKIAIGGMALVGLMLLTLNRFLGLKFRAKRHKAWHHMQREPYQAKF